MKRNFATAFAVLASVFFAGATIAEAVDVQFGGQLRPRFEIGEQGLSGGSTGATTGGMDSRVDPEKVISTRIRLEANAKVNDQTSAFIQLQGVGVWGALSNINGSGGRPATTTNDNNVDVGIHQAYFTLKNFFTLPVDLQLGRQEIVLDGHRLLGNVDWTQGARAHDAIRLTHMHGEHAIAYVYSRGVDVSSTGGDPGAHMDVNVHVLYANLKNLLHANSGTSLYVIGVIDDCSPNTAVTACASTADTGPTSSATWTSGTRLDNNNYLLGFRQAGNLAQVWGLDYRAEFYYETGKAEGDARVAATQLGFSTTATDIDRGAYMFGLRLGKTFNDVVWKPTATLWYDQLQGTDDNDVANKNYRTFNQMFYTGHKFYGYMDMFLPANGRNSAFLGLRDFAGKFSVVPMENTTINADIHAFWTQVNVNDNPVIRANLGIPAGSAADSNHLGEELDLTLVHKYNANTNITLGMSHFWADDLFYAVNPKAAPGLTSGATNANGQNPTWGYIMFDVKF